MLNDETNFGMQITRFRESKGVSAREMSLAMGQSPNYMNKIENSKNYPSMEMFFVICDYLNVSAKQFFDKGFDFNTYPKAALINEMLRYMEKLDEKALENLCGILKEMVKD